MFQEFHCSGCEKRLRVRLENVGALTKCPHCETTQIAAASTTDDPIPVASLAPTNPFAEPTANPYRDAPAESNPYAGPQTRSPTAFDHLISQYSLASPAARLAGAFVDWVFFIVCSLPGLLITGFVDKFDAQLADVLGSMSMFVCMLGGQILQWYLISTRGQSLGKLLLGIRIVTVSGSAPGFIYGVLLRQWVFGVIVPCYPLAGIVMIVDALMVFSERRQCLHDLVASTYVVVVKS